MNTQLTDDDCRSIYNAAMELPNRSALSVMRYIESAVIAAHEAKQDSVQQDLLEALKYVIRGVPDTWDGVTKARAAIAKAEGGAA